MNPESLNLKPEIKVISKMFGKGRPGWGFGLDARI